VSIINAYVKEEHEDNRRFLADCEKWFNHPITILQDEKFGASATEVWKRKRFLANGMWGAPCSYELKRTVLNKWCRPEDIFVMGYTIEEEGRIARFFDANNGRKALFPLVDRNLTHADCLAIVERAGIELPAMYRLGYNNANCIGCCRGGEGYWNKIRVDFPERFEEVCVIQDILGPGSYIFRDRNTGERFSLRQLPPEKGRHDEELPSCSFFCAMAEKEIGK
jgi:hypothetical protein